MRYFTISDTWTLISSNANVAFQVTGAHPVSVGAGVSAPTVGFTYNSMSGDRGAVSELFPNVNSDNVWARASANSSIVVC